eukprot:CAMPEP_0194525284 /NCGR_PEP_ID=MMETSP0253-20130528/60704_1 /TAXON_ID=2966 /ORGANISM="Noctiluca scintillans" /LENGTH=346 /DNA_ID=CAMNT_0039369995 /DNA_START=149 /DNA_END=1191 /DNA_ORIENTATION=+
MASTSLPEPPSIWSSLLDRCTAGGRQSRGKPMGRPLLLERTGMLLFEVAASVRAQIVADFGYLEVAAVHAALQLGSKTQQDVDDHVTRQLAAGASVGTVKQLRRLLPPVFFSEKKFEAALVDILGVGITRESAQRLFRLLNYDQQGLVELRALLDVDRCALKAWCNEAGGGVMDDTVPAEHAKVRSLEYLLESLVLVTARVRGPVWTPLCQVKSSRLQPNPTDPTPIRDDSKLHERQVAGQAVRGASFGVIRQVATEVICCREEGRRVQHGHREVLQDLGGARKIACLGQPGDCTAVPGSLQGGGGGAPARDSPAANANATVERERTTSMRGLGSCSEGIRNDAKI